jgi:ligand-binding sensor domain-containing protein
LRYHPASWLIFSISIVVQINAFSFEWKSFTTTFKTNSLCAGKTELWIGTEGGLMSFDPDNSNFSTWTNTEGLASNKVTAITVDDNDRIWIGFNNGLIQRFDHINAEWLLVDDYKNNTITCLTLSGDTLFVGLDIGVSLYLISRMEVKETYKHLGSEFQVEIPVLEIITFDHDIWVATEQGIAYSSLDYSNLLDPESWTNVTSIGTISAQNITGLASLDGNVYVGTDMGIGKWNGSVWTILDSESITDLTIHDNQLYISKANRVYRRYDESWLQIGDTLSSINLISSGFSTLWCGSQEGIYRYSEQSQNWEHYLPNCQGSNIISDISVDQNGYLWCTSRDNGFCCLKDNEWTIYNLKSFPDLWTNDVVAVNVDGDNNKWIGTWGKGAIFLTPDSSFRAFRAVNGYLAGIAANYNYAVVSHIVTDDKGATWLINREAVTNQPLVSVSSDSMWTYYGINEGIFTTFLKCITVDMENRKWIGSDANGIYILDDNGTPSYKGDDPPVSRLTTADGLESNEITALATDRDGVIWIGTPKGLHYYAFGTVNRRYGLPSDNITAIMVDGANNLWTGTNMGVSIFSINTYSWTHYTEENSGLVDNDVISLALNPNSGMIYIGTNHGLSALDTPFSEPRAELSDLKVYPNPFIPAEHGYLTIDNLSSNVSIHIYSTSGYLVRGFAQNDVHGRQVFWDGKNRQGERAASGVYIIVAQAEEGENRMTKVALVR